MKHNNGHESFHLRHNLLSWFCLLYALLIIAIGTALPITLGWDLAVTKDALDQYLVSKFRLLCAFRIHSCKCIFAFQEFYIFLYSVGVCYFIFYHTVANTLLNLCIRLWSRLKHYYRKSLRKLPSTVSGIELVNQGKSTDSIDDTEIKLEGNKISSGQYGLKCGIKGTD